MIFISHRSLDKEIVDVFVDFLKIIGVPSQNIFCSSLPGNDIKRKIDVEIKDNLIQSKFNIIFLSEEYYQSAYCLNEAGIIWYNDTPTIIIALPEINENSMIGFIDADYKIRRLNTNSDVSSIYDMLKPNYHLNNNITVLNREIEKLVKRYNAAIDTRSSKTIPKDVNVTDLQITVDEAVVLYYIWKTKKRTIKSLTEIYNWLICSEIYNIDVTNGFDLLVADAKGSLDQSGAFALNIQQFRMLISKKPEEVTNLVELIYPHFRPSKKSFISLWDSDECNDNIKLFVTYICDERMTCLGDRWLAETQVESIKTWELKNNLNNVLSANYGYCLQTFIEHKLVYPISYTSHGNPKEYCLHKSIKEFFYSPDFPYKKELSDIKSKYKYELPF